MYFVDYLKNGEWVCELETEIEENAIKWAETMYQGGFDVKIYHDDHIYWQNGSYVSHYYNRSVFETEWFLKVGYDGMIGATSLPPVTYKERYEL